MSSFRSAQLLVTILFAAVLPLAAQSVEPIGITVGPGSSLTIGPGSQVSVLGGDVHVQEGGLLVNQGDLNVGRDLIIDGTLQTTISGNANAPSHGRITVAGDAEYRGSLSVALARGSSFVKPQDFTLVTYAAGFGELAARKLPGARWSSQHRESELVVSLLGESAPAPERFALEIDAAPLDDRIVIDWIVYFDQRTDFYAVERYDPVQGWRELGKLARLTGDVEAAYYSSVDQDLPKGQSIVRYRLRLTDSTGAWHYSEDVNVYIGREQKLRVFPNPVTGTQVRLLGLDPARKLHSLRLLAADGSLLQAFPVEHQDLYILEIPAATTSGSYFINAEYTDGFSQNATLVVLR